MITLITSIIITVAVAVVVVTLFAAAKLHCLHCPRALCVYARSQQWHIALGRTHTYIMRVQ